MRNGQHSILEKTEVKRKFRDERDKLAEERGKGRKLKHKLKSREKQRSKPQRRRR